MHGVKPQSVETIVVQPHQRVSDQELAHDGPIAPLKIDGRTPTGRMTVAEEFFGVAVQIVQLRPEMIIHHVKVHHQIQSMSRPQKTLEVLRRAIARIGCIQQHAIVAPVMAPRYVVDWHQLDGSDAEVPKIRQLLFDPGIRSLLAEGADMHLVYDGLRPGPSRIRIGISQRGRIHYFARPTDIVGLEERRWIGNDQVLVDAKLVARADASRRALQMIPAVVTAKHATRRLTDLKQIDDGGSRRP